MVIEPLGTTPIRFMPDAHGLLTERTRPIVQQMAEVILEFTRERFPRLTPHVEVGGFIDSEEDTEYITVAVDVPLDGVRALAFWDDLGEAVEQWIETLPPQDAELIPGRIHTRVRWN